MNRLFFPRRTRATDSICGPPWVRMSSSSNTALKERVDFDLVDRGRDVVVLDEIDEPVRVEVRDADGRTETLGVQPLHGSPRAVVVAEGLVD